MNNRIASDFDPALTDTSRCALLELTRVLNAYSHAMVLIGGWVPYLLLRDHQRAGETFRHLGSIDIDFVLDPSQIGDDEYQTVVELISGIGWTPIAKSRFSFERTLPGPDHIPRTIKVDLLTGQPTGPGKKHRHLRLQTDLEARTLPYGTLALSHHLPCVLSGTLPDGAETEVEIEILDVVGCLGTKAFALAGRISNKDAYDIVSIWDNYGSGVKEVGELVKPYVREPLLAEAMGLLQSKFKSIKSEGPVWYANFFSPADDDARVRLSQRAYQLSQEFFRHAQPN